MNLKQLRTRCAAMVATVDVPRPFDLRLFCDRLQRIRGRDIVLVPVRVRSSSPCGLWVKADRTDYICYEESTSPLHREHIALHEIGHLLFDHDGAPVLTEEFTASLVPDLDPAMVRSVLGRSTYTERQEAEAEVFATMVLERAGRLASPVTHADPAVANQLHRVASSLDDPRRGR